MPQSTIGVLVLAVCLSLQVSCKKIDNKKVESAIANHFTEQTGLKTDSVTCPQGVKPEKGDVFECTAKSGKYEIVYKVTQTSGSGDLEWTLRDGVVLSKKLESVLAAEISKQAGEPVKAVDCGERIRPAKKDDTFECVGTDSGDKRWRIGITLTDAAGGFDFKVLGAVDAAAASPPDGDEPGDDE